MQAPPPYVEPPRVGPQVIIHRVDARQPLRWLALGWADLMRYWRYGLLYGACFWGMALVLGLVFQNKPEYTISIASGCLLLGPFLAMGLYEISRRDELGLPVSLFESLTCWRTQFKSMGLLVLVLIVLELLWGRASMVVFAVFFNTGMPSETGAFNALFNMDNLEFLAVYLMVGGFFAFLVFATSVVSIPLMRDKEVDAITAAISSIRVVATNTLTMIVWGALLTAWVVLALLPVGAGLLVVGPWLGHATWHAYRATISYRES